MEPKKIINSIDSADVRFAFESKNDEQFALFNRLSFLRWLDEQTISRKIKLIQNHHTWKPEYANFNDNHFKLMHSMRDYHMMKRNFSDTAQNITTFPDGTIGIGRPLKTAPAGIKGANSYGICIEHIGNFDVDGDTMTPEHEKTILFINAALLDKFNLEANSDTVVYHHWWTAAGKRTNGVKSAKSCPGTNFFGGNKVEDAEAHFIPRINQMLKSFK